MGMHSDEGVKARWREVDDHDAQCLIDDSTSKQSASCICLALFDWSHRPRRACAIALLTPLTLAFVFAC
eukprot:4658-Hanusia_phi.AAC.2